MTILYILLCISVVLPPFELLQLCLILGEKKKNTVQCLLIMLLPGHAYNILPLNPPSFPQP